MASVFHHNRPNTLLARKQISKKVVDQQALKKEVELIREASHLHVIRIIEDYEDEKNFYIVMEPVAKGDLHDHLQESCEGTTSLGEKRLQSFQFM